MPRNMSYFAEERSRNNNPAFFNNMRLQDLRTKVKRIIKDIKNDNIIDNDLIYFTNTNVISALIQESEANWSTNETIKNALIYYYNNALFNNIAPPNSTINQEIVNVTNEITAAMNRAMLWRVCYVTFVNISNGYDIKECLRNIQCLNKNLFYNL